MFKPRRFTTLEIDILLCIGVRILKIYVVLEITKVSLELLYFLSILLFYLVKCILHLSTLFDEASYRFFNTFSFLFHLNLLRSPLILCEVIERSRSLFLHLILSISTNRKLILCFFYLCRRRRLRSETLCKIL